MKKILLPLLIAVISFYSNSQDDWKFPMKNGKIQMEFNSENIATGKKDLCEMYFSTNTITELIKKLSAASSNGKVKFWTASNFTINPQLVAADLTINDYSSYSGSGQCKKDENDTVIGKLTMSLTQIKTIRKSRGGNVTCLFRIILKDNDYNIKFRGFEYSYYKTPGLIKQGEMVVVDLEDEYDEANATKSDKEYWADIKMMVELFHDTLEEVLGGQASDFNFDD